MRIPKWTPTALLVLWVLVLFAFACASPENKRLRADLEEQQRTLQEALASAGTDDERLAALEAALQSARETQVQAEAVAEDEARGSGQLVGGILEILGVAVPGLAATGWLSKRWAERAIDAKPSRAASEVARLREELAAVRSAVNTYESQSGRNLPDSIERLLAELTGQMRSFESGLRDVAKLRETAAPNTSET